MFDTVRFARDSLDLSVRGWRKREMSDDGVSRVTFQAKREGLPYLVYVPKNGTLIFESSLPNARFGENVSMLAPGDVPRVLDDLSNRVADAVGAPIPHCGDWFVRGRLDACYSWNAGARVNDYLTALGQTPLPRHRLCRDGSTVYWKSMRRWIRAYDKGDESKLPTARGLLRIEIQMRRPKGELSKLGVQSVRARDVLNWQTARQVLSRYLDPLGATNLMVTDQARLFSLLLARYSPARATRLWGFALAMRQYGRDGLVARGFKRGYLWRSVNDIDALGVSFAMSESGILPPLRLPTDAEYTGAPGVIGI